jgi:pyruvate carboxylase
MFTCKCIKCSKYKQRSQISWKRAIIEYGARELLRANFICGECQKKQRKDRFKYMLEHSSEYVQLMHKISKEKHKYDATKYGLSFPQCIQKFKETIDKYLKESYIQNYTFIVENNNLTGILINNIPFIKQIILKIYEKTPQIPKAETE